MLEPYRSPAQKLREAIRMVEWGANMRLEAWQIELLRQIVTGRPPVQAASSPEKCETPARRI